MKIKEWLYRWLEDDVLPNMKLRSYARYRDIALLHIIPQLGKRDMGAITYEELRAFLVSKSASGNLKSGRPLSAGTVNLIRTVLASAFGCALERGLINKNPMAAVKRIKTKSKKISAFTLSEQRKIESAIAKCSDGRLIGIKICLYTGVRIGELLALEWKDVDLEQGILYVCKSVYRVKDADNKWVTLIDTPKSEAAVREIPLTRKLLTELRGQYKTRLGEYVVSDKHGRQVATRSYEYIFCELLKRNQIRTLNFHALRHTFATRALESGMDVKTLSELMGHESVEITLKNYAHTFMSTKKEAVNRLDKFYVTAPNNMFDAGKNSHF